MLEIEQRPFDNASHEAYKASSQLDAVHEGASAGNISVLLKILWLRRRMLGAFVIFGLLLGLFVQIFLPPTYSAAIQIAIDFRRLVNINPAEATLNFRLSDAAMDSEVEIMNSGSVLGRAIDDLNLTHDPEFADPSFIYKPLILVGLMPDPAKRSPAELKADTIEALGKAVKAERLGLSYVLEVTAKSKSAVKSAAIADAVGKAFVADKFEARKEVATGAANWFEQRLQQLQQHVAEAQKEAVDFRLKNQIMLAGGKFVDEQQVQDLSIRMLDAKQQSIMATARFERIEAMIKGDRAVDGILTGGLDSDIKNLVMVGLLGQYHETAVRMSQNMLRYGPAHEAVRLDQAKMREIQSEVLEEFKRMAEGYRSEAAIAEKQEASLVGMLKDVAQRSTESQKARVQLTILQGAADSYAALRDKFVEEFSTSTQEQTYPITEARILGKATVPSKPSMPVVRKTLVVGIAGGLVLGFLFVTGSETLSQILRSRRSLEVAVGRPCLGYIPNIKSLALAAEGNMAFLDAATGADFLTVQTLRSTLLHARNFDAKVIGVTGIADGDGASTFAHALAGFVASEHNRVLLVDTDFRRRSLSKRFAPQAKIGILDAIEFGLSEKHITSLDQTGNFWLLPNLDKNPERGFSAALNGELSKIIRQAQSVFDFVIIDLPPLGVTLDARAVANDIDAFVLVTRWGETKFKDVVDCLSSSPELESSLMGAIYNMISLKNIEDIDDGALIALMDASKKAKIPIS